MTECVWSVVLTARASADIVDIAEWTTRQFGSTQAERYSQTIDTALASLSAGPSVFGSRDCSVGERNLRSLHLPRPGRHLIVYRVADAQRLEIEVVRILHDAMDLPRHLAP